MKRHVDDIANYINEMSYQNNNKNVHNLPQPLKQIGSNINASEFFLLNKTDLALVKR